MRDEFSTSTAPDPRCGFIRINEQKLTANGPAAPGRLRINTNKNAARALSVTVIRVY